jgi:hypothetical protein
VRKNDTFFVLDLGLDIVDGVAALDLESETVADDLMVEALRPVKDGIATVAEVTEAMMKILLE